MFSLFYSVWQNPNTKVYQIVKNMLSDADDKGAFKYYVITFWPLLTPPPPPCNHSDVNQILRNHLVISPSPPQMIT